MSFIDSENEAEIIDGNWGDWSSWTACSKSCGVGGMRVRERGCNNPAPENGGKYCEGEGEAVEACNEEPCQPGEYF